MSIRDGDPFKNLTNFFQSMSMPSQNMEMALATHQKNVEVLSQAQQTAAEVFKTMVGLNSQYLKKILDHSSAHAQSLSHAEGMQDKAKKQMEFVNAQANYTFNHGRDLVNALAESTNKVLDICTKRFHESWEEGQDFFRPAAPAVNSGGHPRQKSA